MPPPTSHSRCPSLQFLSDLDFPICRQHRRPWPHPDVEHEQAREEHPLILLGNDSEDFGSPCPSPALAEARPKGSRRAGSQAREETRLGLWRCFLVGGLSLR